MIEKNTSFKYTNSVIFFSEAPLRYSQKCFELEHASRAAKTMFDDLQIVAPKDEPKSFVNDICLLFVNLMCLPVSLSMAGMTFLYVAPFELMMGVMAYISYIALTIFTAPVVGLLALGELISTCFDAIVDDTPSSAPCFI